MKAYKITRNEPCPCGSGKKYKKCCLGQDKVERIEKNYWDTNPSPIKEQKNVLIVTTTKEVAMPIRLYYKVHDKLTLIKCLDRLKCICWSTENHFLINYMKEAKNIGLMVKYSKVPPELYPIILADGHIEEDQLHLDLRSFERAICMIKFIDKHINRNTVEITDIATYNEVQEMNGFNLEKVWQPKDHNKLFSEGNVEIIDPEKVLNDLKDLREQFKNEDDEEKREEKLAQFLDNNSNFGLIEKFPVYYYDRGIKPIEMALNLRMALAIEHWEGNKEFTIVDMVAKLIENK